MTISLIVPIHNAEQYLQNTLQALDEALGPQDQLIAVFDNCQDRSLSTLERWRDSRHAGERCEVVISETAFGDVAKSRNRGLELADRSWVAFADHDDYVVPTIYEELLRGAEHFNADVVRCGYGVKKPQSLEIVYPDFPPDYYAFFGIFIWNSLFRRELIIENGLRFKPGYGEDYEFNLQIAQYCNHQAFVRKPLYYWNVHGDNHHLARKPEDFLKRAVGIYSRNLVYLQRNPNAGAAFRIWVTNYLTHLRATFGEPQIDAAIKKEGCAESLQNIVSLGLAGERCH